MTQIPGNLGLLIEHQRIRSTPVPGGSACRAERLTLDDGTDLFAKTLADAPPGFFASEARGLAWLAESETVPIPGVLAWTDELLVLDWIPPGEPTALGAEEFGRGLARLHRAGAPSFGAGRPGFIGGLPLDNSPAGNWPEFYAERRIRPYLRQAVDLGYLSTAESATIDRVLDRLPQLAGPSEPVARIHGDLWAGNVHFGQDGRAWLIDPAAHGGHRETDLAMLALFGLPMLARVLTAYAEEFPLADGWRDRVALHQLHPLLVHAVLFGGGYGRRAAELASRYR